MNLLYIAFGNDNNIHKQIAFSIYSVLSQKSPLESINVFTDNESMYRHFGSKINLYILTAEEISDWRGRHNYLWRIKIKSIQKACEMYPGRQILYLDGDTFFYQNISVITSYLNAGKAVMHEKEGLLSLKKSKTQKKMWMQIAGKTFSGITIESNLNMWNAGVIGFPNSNAGEDIAHVLSVCDEMCDKGVQQYFIEQFSFSVVLEKYYGLEECREVVAHYWSARTLWNNKINDFFLKAYFSKWDFETSLNELRNLDKTDVPVFIKVKNTRKRLNSFTEKIFPDTGAKYLG